MPDWWRPRPVAANTTGTSASTALSGKPTAERNARFGQQIGKALEERGIVSRLPASKRVAQWAYGQTEAAHGLTWLRADEMVPLSPAWRALLAAQ